jgi:uncharacterized protein (DUF1697 family)
VELLSSSTGEVDLSAKVTTSTRKMGISTNEVMIFSCSGVKRILVAAQCMEAAAAHLRQSHQFDTRPLEDPSQIAVVYVQNEFIHRLLFINPHAIQSNPNNSITRYDISLFLHLTSSY